MKMIFSMVFKEMLVDGFSSGMTRIEKGRTSAGMRRGMWVASTGMPPVTYVPAQSVREVAGKEPRMWERSRQRFSRA
jgi:hypothetical protein